MMSEKNFLISQKECAEMLGMSLEDYQNDCKEINFVSKNKISKRKTSKKYDNSILKKLGLTQKDLMKRRD